MSDKQPIQPEDLFKMEFLQGAHFSSDGKQVVYSVSHVDTETDKEKMTIWLLGLDTGKNRRMTTGKSLDAFPQLSPDGKTIAFMSDRGEKLQIYTIPVDGGEASQLTNLKQGVGSGPAWSHDGAKIAFTAGPAFEGDKPPDLTKEVYRVTRNVYRFDFLGYLDQYVQDIYVVDFENGNLQQLTDDAFNNLAPNWSPDGERIMYRAGMNPETFTSVLYDLAIVDLDQKIQTFPNNAISVTGNNWSPDGKKIIFVGRPITGLPIGSKNDLWVLDIDTGSVENRSKGLGVGVGGSLSLRTPTRIESNVYIPVTTDGKFAYVRVQEGGNLHVYRVALSGEERWAPVVTGDRNCSILDMHEGKLLLAIGDMNAPQDVFTANLDGSKETQWTHINQAFFVQIALPETEHLLFPGQDGVPVEGWYMKPVLGEAPYPTILYIHGGPHAAYGRGFSFDFHMLAGQGYGVLFINHRASTGYGDPFSTAIKGDWGNLDYGDLMAGVDHAISLGLADGDRLGCCGTSGGGNLSTWIVGHTNRFKAAIPQNPVTNWNSFYGTSDIGVWFSVEQLGGHPHEIPEIYTKCSPINYAHRCTTPTLMVQSEHDWRCPAEQSEQFYTILKANGCTVEMLRQPGGSHGASIYGAINLRREHLVAMVDWFGKYVLA